MALAVAAGATLACSSGTAPANLIILPDRTVMCGAYMGNIGDCVPVKNIPPFSKCTSLLNPDTASKTASAGGILTPGMCVPTPAGPWQPASPTIKVQGMPALHQLSTLTCSLGGTISIVDPACKTPMILA